MANYTPLAWLSYAIDYAVWGLNPVGYHLSNILFHALNAVLFFRLSLLLLRSIFPDEKPRLIEIGAIVAALSFAVHPLRVESVAWAAERRDVLSGAFFLATVIFYVKAASAREARESFQYRVLSILSFTAAALSKASVVPLPVALLALDYYPLKRLGGVRELRARLLEKLPYAVIAGAAALMVVRAQFVTSNFVAASKHGAASRLAQALFGAGFYISKTLIPTGLCALYPLDHRDLLAAAALQGAALAAVAGACAALGVSRKAQAALWGFYLAMLLPVLGLLQNGPQLVALRYSYLPCLGWAALAGAAAVWALKNRRVRRVRSGAILGTLALVLVSNAWAVQRQIALWRDDRAVWGNVASRFPLSAIANMNLADADLQAGDPPAAEKHARAALALAPDSELALVTLAHALLGENRKAEARAAVESGLKTVPDWGEGHAMLGVFLNEEGRAGEALSHLRRAADLLPASAEAQANAGSLLALRGRFADALPYFERAAKLEPAYASQLDRVRLDLERASRKP